MEINGFIGTGKAEGWLRETDNYNDVRLDGKQERRRVYEVRTDKLHYNVQNGRIATFVSRYEAEHGTLPQDPTELNDLIESMIERDNPQRLKTTRLDIKAKGQQEPAVILSDGVVIDGNRRFTCLRMLAREANEPRFLRCYIFPDTYDEKAIKGLELEIQLGRDEKVSYDPITRLVDINTWVNSGRMTKEEYARHAGMKDSEMKGMLAQIEVLNDFLDFIGAPGAYHIAQDMKLQGVIESLASRMAGRQSGCKNDDEREDVENIVFANVLMGNLGDRTRVVRDLYDRVLESLRGDGEFAEEQLDVADRVLEKLEGLPENTEVTTELIRDRVAADNALKNEQLASFEKARAKAGNRKIKDGQVRSVHDALSSLEGIERGLLGKLAPENLDDMHETLGKLLRMAEDLRAEVDGFRAHEG